MLAVVVSFTLSSRGAHCQAQDNQPTSAAAKRFDELDARYWKILTDRPREGTALERWYRNWADAGRAEELMARVNDAVQAEPNNAQLQLLWGLLLQRRGDFPAAQAAVGAAADLATDDYYPHFALGKLAAQRGKLDEAAAALLRAAELNPPQSQWLDIYKQLGRVQLRGGQRHEALSTWAKVAEQFPDDVPVLQELAELLTAEGQYEAAIERWQQVAANAKTDRNLAVEAERKIAGLEAQAGRRDEAVARLDNLLNRLEPNSWLASDVRRQIELLFVQRSDRTELIAYYRRRLKSRADDLNTMLALAAALQQSGDNEEAIALLTSIVERSPENDEAQWQLIQLQAEQGNFNPAIEQAQAFIVDHPRDVEAIRRLAELEVQAAIAEEDSSLFAIAGETFRKMASVRSDEPALALTSAQACEAAGRQAELYAAEKPLFEVAESLYREAVQRAPERAEFHEQLGAYLHRQDDPQGALEAWKPIAAGSEDTAERCLQLAEILNRYEFPAEAIAELRRSLEHDPSQTKARQQLARWLTNGQAYDDALTEIEHLQQTATSTDELQAALELRVDVLRLEHRVDAALAELQQPAAEGEASFEDHWLLALLWLENRQPEAALAEIEAALSLQPQDSTLLNTAAVLATKADKPARAIEIYEQLATLDPQRATVHLSQAARVHLMHGEAEQARAVAERIVAEHPTSPTGYRLLAEVSAFSGMPDERLAALQRAVEVAPSDASLQKQLAELLERRGRDDAALEHYRRAFELVDSHVERLHLVSLLVPLAERTRSYPQLLEFLRETSRQRGSSPEEALLVVEALRQAGELQLAFQETQSLLSQAGEQREVLETAVLLAEALGNFETAADLQRRVVRLDPHRPALEKLAECSLAAGDEEGARDAWRRIVRDLEDPQAIYDTIDSELRRGELIASQLLLSVALEVRPNDWGLLLRAAHVASLEGDESKAIQYLTRVLDLPSNEETTAHVTPSNGDVADLNAIQIPTDIAAEVPEVGDYQVAKRTLELLAQQRWVTNLAVRQEKELSKRKADRHRAEAYARVLRHQRAEQQRKVSSQFSVPDNLDHAKVVALCGLWEIASESGDLNSWLQAQRNEANAHVLARLSAVALADKHYEQGRQLLADSIEKDPESASPHLLRLTAFQDDASFTSLSAESKSEALADLEASQKWISTHRPAWAIALAPSYWNAMISMQAGERVRSELRSAIEEATEIKQLPPLAVLATRLSDLVLQRQVFEKAVELPLGEVNRAGEIDALQRLLEQKFLYSDDEQYVAAMIAAMGRYLEATQPTAELLETSDPGAATENTSTVPPRFPWATPHINARRLKVLSHVYQHCAAASRVFVLQDYLQSRVEQSKEIDRQCFMLSRSYVQWWSGELGASLDTLRSLCEAYPSVAAFRVILSQALVADGSPELALEVLDSLPSPTVIMGYSTDRLRRQLIDEIVADDD